jgi:transposase
MEDAVRGNASLSSAGVDLEAQWRAAAVEAGQRAAQAEQQAERAERRAVWAETRVQQLEEKLRLILIKKYGPSSENLSVAQLTMFEEEPGATLDEVAAEAAREALPEEAEAAKPKRERRPHPGRQTLPPHLRRVVETIACEPAQCVCRCCGGETAVIGYQESERLDVEPAKYFVKVTRREKRACPRCKQGVQTAPLAGSIVEKGLASDRVVIDTVVAKYCDHLPLYRQSAMLERETGLELSRATLDGWVMRVGERLEPIAEAMEREILRGSYIQADETTVDVQLRHEKKGKNHQAYLWQFGNPGGMAVFRFAMGRQAAVAERVLRGYRGLLQTDGYQIYDGLTQAVHAGCMAHARRYFIDAVKLNPGDRFAVPLVERMDALFAVERRAREDGLSLEARHELRQRESRGVIEKLKEELERVKDEVLPQSQNGKGIHYALAQWEKLTRFLDHPELELSNNLAERAMRGTAIGRKNWLHVGSPAAGPRVAAILSVVESARRLRVSAREYFAEILPGLGDRKLSEIPELTIAAWARRRAALPC